MYDGGTSSLYERWISGFPFKSRIAMREAIEMRVALFGYVEFSKYIHEISNIIMPIQHTLGHHARQRRHARQPPRPLKTPVRQLIRRSIPKRRRQRCALCATDRIRVVGDDGGARETLTLVRAALRDARALRVVGDDGERAEGVRWRYSWRRGPLGHAHPAGVVGEDDERGGEVVRCVVGGCRCIGDA